MRKDAARLKCRERRSSYDKGTSTQTLAQVGPAIPQSECIFTAAYHWNTLSSTSRQFRRSENYSHLYSTESHIMLEVELHFYCSQHCTDLRHFYGLSRNNNDLRIRESTYLVCALFSLFAEKDVGG